MMEEMTEIIVYSVFPEEDDFGTDAWEYRIYIDGEMVKKYGDDYHDHGHYKSQGFVDCYVMLSGLDRKEIKIKYEEIADESVL